MPKKNAAFIQGNDRILMQLESRHDRDRKGADSLTLINTLIVANDGDDRKL
jgi:hypothetical protein